MILLKIERCRSRIVFFRTLFRVTHRKILIVDERIAFIGGINIKKFFKKWDDLSIRMEGRVVERILNSFAYIYIKLWRHR